MRLLKNKLIVVLLIGSLIPQDLWKDSGEVFTDKTVRLIGSIIYVQFEGQMLSRFQSSYQNLKINHSDFIKDLPKIFDFLPKTDLNTSKQNSGDVAYNVSSQLAGSIAFVISKVNREANTYTIKSTQNWIVNGEPTSIAIISIVNQIDVDYNGYINSQKMANTQINFLGREFKKGKKIREKDFDSLKFPYSQSNTISINESQKKRLYLEFINLILDQLF